MVTAAAKHVVIVNLILQLMAVNAVIRLGMIMKLAAPILKKTMAGIVLVVVAQVMYHVMISLTVLVSQLVVLRVM